LVQHSGEHAGLPRGEVHPVDTFDADRLDAELDGAVLLDGDRQQVLVIGRPELRGAAETGTHQDHLGTSRSGVGTLHSASASTARRSRVSRSASLKTVWSKAIPSSAVSETCRSPSSGRPGRTTRTTRSEEHTSELQSRENLVCRHLLEKKNKYASL